MTNNPKLKQLFCLCLILAFGLAGCSSEDESTDQDKSASQASAEDGRRVAGQDADNSESLYSQAIKGAGTVSGDYKTDYKAALKALENEDYDKARDLLNSATTVNNIEQLKIRFTGMAFGSYLPHYHLGMIAFLDYDCVGAMKEWETSLRQGAVQQAPEHQFLQEAMLECKAEGA